MVSKYYRSPRWSTEMADCSMPLTFDQYSNCAFSCLYCFSAYQRAVGDTKEAYLSRLARPVNVSHVKRLFLEPQIRQKGTYIKKRMTMQWGGLSDPFCGFERKYEVGLELLRFFKSIDYPLCFSTKGTWWLDDPRYSELFRGQKNWNVKVSIITLDEAKAKVIEQGVVSPQQRLEAIEKIVQLDCGGATLRLRPFMFGITDPHHCELISEAGKRGADALSTEFFCLERRSPVLKDHLPTISDQADMDYLTFYRRYSSGSGYLRLNRNIKRQFVNQMEDACRSAGMRFYVSDAHFKERCDNGSCCGLSSSWNYSRGQFCEALIICKERGQVRWSDIADSMEHFKDDEWRYSDTNTGNCENRSQYVGLSIYEYLRWTWNHPMRGQSPYRMFEGVMKPVGLDDHQNVIYEYDESKA